MDLIVALLLVFALIASFINGMGCVLSVIDGKNEGSSCFFSIVFLGSLVGFFYLLIFQNALFQHSYWPLILPFGPWVLYWIAKWLKLI